MIKELLFAFITGGVLCLIAQMLMDTTKMVSGQILVSYVVAGVILSALGLYNHLVDFGGCGATVPLTGFGHSLAQGTAKAIEEKGFIGIFTGGLSATAGGIAAAVVFGFIFAVIGKAKTKF